MTARVGKKVLMLLENNPYWQDIRAKQEARALAAAGYQVSVICPGDVPGFSRDSERSNIMIWSYRSPPPGKGILGYSWEYGYSIVMMSFYSLLVWRRHGFDIIHAHNPPDMLVLVAAIYKLMGKRIIFDHHDLSPEMGAVRYSGMKLLVLYPVLIWFEKLSCRMADHVIATNASYRAIEIERSNVAPEKITIVRNGPAATMQPVPIDPELRARATVLLGYVGIMGPQDGIDYLLRALQHLKYTLNVRGFLCVLIGKGDYLEELRQLAMQLGIADNVWFTGWIPYADLLRYLSTVDICLDPDPSNAFNDRSTMIKILEYMALGKPIVAFDLPEHRVSAADAAVYALSNSELDFARNIKILATDSQRRERMGAVGRHRVLSELGWSFQATKLLDAYARLRE